MKTENVYAKALSYYCGNIWEVYLARDFYYYTVEVKLYFTVWYYGLKGYKFNI